MAEVSISPVIHPPLAPQCRVQLRFATLPLPLRLIAVHLWFVVRDVDGCHRWEVWQRTNAGGSSIGHLHCDLLPADAGVGGGPMHVAADWSGHRAAEIAAVLRNARSYRYCDRYL